MIGALTYELRAETPARLPFINGRYMHAAFFKIINENSPALGTFIHSKMNLKPFTVSFLDPAERLPSFEERWQVRSGDKFFWRVTGLNAKILQAAMSVPVDYKIQAGALTLSVEDIRVDSSVAVKDFISGIKNHAPIKEICFNFVSPVSFRINNFDAPYPRAELIFASLADKWTQAEMPASIDKKVIRELAAQIRLKEWEGQSKRFYFAPDRGLLAFWGKFSYSVEALSDSVQKVFLLLAKFGEFSSVGRLTGQGFGQTRIDFF